MKILNKISQMQKLAKVLHGKGKSMGFVPTMGALHEGHLSLMGRARKENDVVVVSIFVNPTQFGPKENFRRYPRNLKKDAELCNKVGVDYIFAPSVKVMYPEGYVTYVNVHGHLTEVLEGKSRPGHFRGVATVVAKLFNIVQPDKAYFGEKDFQQLMVIKKMASDLNMPVKIIPCSLIRERDGLSMSSRNVYLNPRERKAALVLSRALKTAKASFVPRSFAHAKLDAGTSVRLGDPRANDWQSALTEPTSPPLLSCESPHKGDESKKGGLLLANLAGGASFVKNIIKKIRKTINKETEVKLDYVAVRDGETFEPVKKIKKGCVILLAARVGKTRLIDNINLED